MALAPTDTLGRYEIVEPLGSGAMGHVYLGRDPLIGRLVALKTLAVGPDSAGVRESSGLSEARSAGVLSHPNIVNVHDVIDLPEHGLLCIAMEYVEGTDLQEMLKRPQAVSLEFTATVVSQVAAALDYAHARGVVHRDVKPGNIIVGDDGIAKIADFGISHLKSSAISADLMYLGTPHYLAPERIRGDAADSRADVFSLGVVLYELLARRHPFAGDSVKELTRAITEEEPAPLETFLPNASAELVALVGKALAKDPDERYGTAGELAADLRRVVTGQESLTETQPTVVAASGKPVARRWWVYAIPAAAAVLLVVALASTMTEPPALDNEVPAAPVSEIQRLTPLVTEARSFLDAGDPGAARALLERATEMSPASRTVANLYELAGSQATLERVGALEIEVMELVVDGRRHLAAGRLRSATRAASAALSLDPEHVEAGRLWDALARARRRVAEEAAMETEAVPVPEPRPLRPPPVSAPPVAPPEPDSGTVLISFSSARPRGVLTLYSGDRQVLLRPFRFVERKGLLRRRPTAGSFIEELELPRGAKALRVYVTLPGSETQIAELDFDLRGGTTRELAVDIDEDGRLTTNLP